MTTLPAVPTGTACTSRALNRGFRGLTRMGRMNSSYLSALSAQSAVSILAFSAAWRFNHLRSRKNWQSPQIPLEFFPCEPATVRLLFGNVLSNGPFSPLPSSPHLLFSCSPVHLSRSARGEGRLRDIWDTSGTFSDVKPEKSPGFCDTRN